MFRLFFKSPNVWNMSFFIFSSNSFVYFKACQTFMMKAGRERKIHKILLGANLSLRKPLQHPEHRLQPISNMVRKTKLLECTDFQQRERSKIKGIGDDALMQYQYRVFHYKPGKSVSYFHVYKSTFIFKVIKMYMNSLQVAKIQAQFFHHKSSIWFQISSIPTCTFRNFLLY